MSFFFFFFFLFVWLCCLFLVLVLVFCFWFLIFVFGFGFGFGFGLIFVLWFCFVLCFVFCVFRSWDCVSFLAIIFVCPTLSIKKKIFFFFSSVFDSHSNYADPILLRYSNITIVRRCSTSTYLISTI